MQVECIELRRVALPLIAPFHTSYGVEAERDALVVRVRADGADGWSECVAPATPGYCAEYTDAAIDVTRRFLVPLVLADAGAVDPSSAPARLQRVAGHPMAKAALAGALLDAALRRAGRSLASHLGATRHRVPAGVAVGIERDLDRLVEGVAARLAEGYQRVKLKIEPGWDLVPLRAVRRALPGAVLAADANGAYRRHDRAHLLALDEVGLQYVEQPLPSDDLLGHADLARVLRTPVCLDESITSFRTARDAVDAGACSVVNVKQGRVGGVAEAVRIHDLCRERGVDAWVGGMLETGLGRAVNVALAALPGFTLTGDLSASGRWFATDLTAPFVLDDGHLAVPAGPGLGVDPRPDVLDTVTTWREDHRPR